MHQEYCPVCRGAEKKALIELPDYPVYQQPVEKGVQVSPPYAVNLHYDLCLSCGHAWQATYNKGLLEEIYRYYYYTPSPENVGTEYRKEFVQCVEKMDFPVPQKVLEIGSSSGEVIAELTRLWPSAEFLGVEPNNETCEYALRNGFNTVKCFFGRESAQALGHYDLIYARHLIEHIFDQEDFFAGVAAVSHERARLILETPCLDWSVEQRNLTPFHVEHLHVFSLSSLIRLASRYGWNCCECKVTSLGAMIVVFHRGAAQVPSPAIKVGDELESTLREQKHRVFDKAHDKKLIIWGAGSTGCFYLRLLGKRVKYLVDGNPNKVGKVFVGFEQDIQYGPELLSKLVAAGEDQEYRVLITSTFHKEIKQTLQELEWRGDTEVLVFN